MSFCLSLCQQRTEVGLRERCYNIKRDLKKLANHHLATVLETGGGAVSQNATKKCTVSFQLTKSVMLFSGTVQLSTTGFSSTDSDAPITYAMSVLEKMENAPTIGENGNENAEDGANEKNSDDDQILLSESESLLTQLCTTPSSPLLTPVVGAFNALASADADADASTPPFCDTPAGRSQRSLFPNAQFFSTTQQRTRAKKRMESIEVDNNSSASTASNSTKRTHISKTTSNSTTSINSNHTSVNRDEYYEKKAALVNEEIKRRAEWHEVCIALKEQELLVQQEELSLKRRQAEFWTKATSKLDENIVWQFYSFPVRSFAHSFFVSDYR